MLGALFAAGFGPDALDRYTWDQLGLMGECIARHHAAMLDAVLRPIAAGLGMEYAPGKVERGPKKRSTSVDYTDLDAVKRAKERDARILLAAGQIPGIKVEL